MPHDARRTARRIPHPPRRETGREAFPLRPVAQAISIAVCGIALHAALAQPVLAQAPSAPAQAPAARQAYRIPAGALAPALRSLASTANLLLTFTEEQTRGKTTAGVSGQHTPQGALAAVLAGTGLQAVPLDNGGYVLRAAPAPAPAASVPPPATGNAASLAAVTVTAAAVRAGDLPEAYAGGQVARGGRLGLLGNVDVMDTPFNVTNYTAQLIEDQQAETVLDVLKNEPSVRQTAPAGNPAEASFKIRGFGLSPGAVTFDGLHGMAPASGDLSTEFAERVEVLKGPSALLYGMSPSGAVGGAINLVPKRAGDAPLTRLTLGLESKTLWKAQVDTGRRFGANNEWGLRFNGRYKDGDKFVDGAKNGGNLGALALDYRGKRARLTLDAYRMQEKQRGGGTIGIFRLNSGLTAVPAAPDTRTNMYPGSPESKETTQAVILGGEYDFNDRWTGYAKVGVQRSEFEGPVNGWLQNVQANGDATMRTDNGSSFARTKSAETGLRGRFQTGTVSHSVALSALYL